jgi:hypothetical protein
MNVELEFLSLDLKGNTEKFVDFINFDKKE